MCSNDPGPSTGVARTANREGDRASSMEVAGYHSLANKLASEGNTDRLANVILNHGVSVDTRDAENGATLLHLAAANGHTETVLLLLRLGACTSVVIGGLGTPLHQAAWGGHVSTVKAMFEAGCLVDVVDSNGWLVLHAAAAGGNAEVIRVVLSTGCDMNAAANDSRTPLHVAARKGNTEAALELIRHGAEKAIVAGARGTPFHEAAVGGHVSTVKAMLEAGCPVDVLDSDGWLVLHAAAAGGNAEVVREVLSTGCDMNAADNDGWTPLHMAAVEGNTEAALELIRHGAEKAIVAGVAGTPLHDAAMGGHVSTVKAMLEAGCPVDVVNSDGWLVLHFAAAGGNAEVVREVLSTGCDMNAAANDGRTSLHMAARKGNTEAALELIRHGAEKAIVAGEAGTPLHQAAVGGHVSTVKAMLEAGCPVDVVNSDGWRVLHAAAAGGNAEVVREVLSTGCDMNAAANDGRTSLHMAARKGNTEAALELIKHGAEKAIVAGEAGTPLHQAAEGGHVSTVKAMLEAGCPVDVVDSNGWLVLHAACGNAEVVREVLSTGCDMNAADNGCRALMHVAAEKGNTEVASELMTHGAEKAIKVETMFRFTPLHFAVLSENKDCVRVLLEHGADPRKPAPYLGSAYHCAASLVPAVVDAFDRCLIEEDQWLPEVHKLLPGHAWFNGKGLDKRSALVRDMFGISTLEYMLIWGMAESDEHVFDTVVVDLSYINADNLLLLATIHGLNTFVGKLTNTASLAHRPSFGAQTVTSLVNLRSSLTLMLHLRSLVPPDASLNLLHVAVLAMKGRCENDFIDTVRADHSSLLKFLVTSNSFHHTLHDYLPNGLTPLDLAEKLGLEEAATIISSAGGRHGIYTMFSNEDRLQYGPAILLAHQELMKLASSGPRGQQIAQVVYSQLPGRSTVEQGTATEESHLCQQKVLDQRPDLSVISTYVIGLVNVDRWRRLGVSLKIPLEPLTHISSTHSSCEDRYLEVLIYWLDHNKGASWRALLEVLGHFETKQKMNQLTQDILSVQYRAVSCLARLMVCVHICIQSECKCYISILLQCETQH